MTIEIPNWLVSLTFFTAYGFLISVSLALAGWASFKVIRAKDVFWCLILILYMRKRGIEKFTEKTFRNFCLQLRDENPRALKGVTGVAMTYQRYCTDEKIAEWEKQNQGRTANQERPPTR